VQQQSPVHLNERTEVDARSFATRTPGGEAIFSEGALPAGRGGSRVVLKMSISIVVEEANCP
jgi:hypothetical protein